MRWISGAFSFFEIVSLWCVFLGVFFANIVFFHHISIRMYIHLLLVLKFDNIIVNVTLKQTLRYETQTIPFIWYKTC